MDLGLAVAISLSSSSKALGQTSVDRTLTMAAQATVCINDNHSAANRPANKNVCQDIKIQINKLRLLLLISISLPVSLCPDIFCTLSDIATSKAMIPR